MIGRIYLRGKINENVTIIEKKKRKINKERDKIKSKTRQYIFKLSKWSPQLTLCSNSCGWESVGIGLQLCAYITCVRSPTFSAT